MGALLPGSNHQAGMITARCGAGMARQIRNDTFMLAGSGSCP
jgi:hypothetical protein